MLRPTSTWSNAIRRNEMTAERRKRPPTHPGAILREDVLPALGLSKTATAHRAA